MVETQIERDHSARTGSESVTMDASIEAASTDLFLPEIHLMGKQLSGSAALRFEN